ncbi:MAG: N-acetylmuramoyl-L-alanine amidase [Candidatus Aureabacteria bacterium]|nr:N-acetylmuramoyl-L-alanine amidase [Candidatus Auribacterota bacterium]
MSRNLKFFVFYSLALMFMCLCADAFAVPAEAQKGDWKYIVIHHSATETGNAAIFDKAHRRRGMRNGLAYHFVIDNGTSGRRDGQIETGSRWKRQIEGGHVRQRWLNIQGIGICIVGNLNEKCMTEKQYWSLVWLTKHLMKKYNIPQNKVLFHGKIKGESTECPGKKFPYARFQKDINISNNTDSKGKSSRKTKNSKNTRGTAK